MNGFEGLEVVCLFILEIVISDVLMLEKDGFWLCIELKKDLLIDYILVVLFIGLGEDFKIYGWKSGVDVFIVKFFFFIELRVRIE